MTSLKANDKAKAKIDNRYLLISIPFILLAVLGIIDFTNHHLLHNLQKTGGESMDIYFLLSYIGLFFFILVVNPIRFNRIVQSIELGTDKVKIITFPFDIKYFPYKRKAIEIEADKDKVDYKKLNGTLVLLVGLVGILPFSNIYLLRYNGKNYYLVPSLFSENVLEAVAEHA